PANRPEPKNIAEQLQRALEEGQTGPKPVIIGLVFAVVSLFVTIGAALMLTRKLTTGHRYLHRGHGEYRQLLLCVGFAVRHLVPGDPGKTGGKETLPLRS